MKKPKLIPEFRDIPTPRQKMPELSLEERKLNFREVELGYTEEMALKEAARCLSCRRCIGCGLCLAECDQQAIVYDQALEVSTVEADRLIYAGDLVAYNPTEDWLGYRKSSNVITSYELERLLSPTGPFGGYVLRLSDGEVPRAIAFIQCVGSRGMGAEYCSTECCRTTLLQVKRLRELIPDVAVTIFHKGLRPCGRDGELLLKEIEECAWVDLIEQDVIAISETQAGSLAVKAGEGESIREFDLVVLAVGARPPSDLRRISLLKSKLNRFGFFDCDLNSLIKGFSSIASVGRVCGLIENQYGLLLARVLGGLYGARAQQAERNPLSGKSLVVFGCQYGFQTGGGENLQAILMRLQEQSQDIIVGGIHEYLCHGEGRTQLLEKAKDASRIIIIGCHSGSHEAAFADILNTTRDCITIVSSRDASKLGLESIGKPNGSSVRKVARSKGQDVVILGAGVSGLAAASVFANCDVTVHLLEKQAKVGGNLSRVAQSNGLDLSAIEAFVDRIRSAPNIIFHTNAEVKRLERPNGRYVLDIGSPQGQRSIECDALLIATGPQLFDPKKYGYGSNPSVITQDDFDRLISGGSLDAERIAVIQCVGARDEHPYCSCYCCRQALKNAIRCREGFPNTRVTVIHKGLRLFGFDECLYNQAVEKGVEFIKSDGRISIEGDKRLRVVAEEANGPLEVNIVVLSVGHCHIGTYSTIGEKFGLDLDRLGFVRTAGNPENEHRTAREGIYICGFARQPMVAEWAFIDGLAAALAMLRDMGEVNQ